MSAPDYADLRPRYHFTAPTNWLNDPNGLVYVDGVYHLFYQHNPNANRFGTPYWGHATSRDLCHWDHQPIVLAPDELGSIYSGSAVIDTANTAGFGHGAIVAVFTHHLREGVERQSVAYSTDGGRSFEKYRGNPVLEPPPRTRDFRDPRVFWWEQGGHGHWVMVLAVGSAIWIYVSDDLLHWEPASHFDPEPATVRGCECPDLAKLEVDGTESCVWLMTAGVDTGDPLQLSGTRYWIGEFDGYRFTASPDAARWADFGADFYAIQSWSSAPDGRHIWIGWMNNWRYAKDPLTEGWSGAMTVPRDVGIVETPDGMRLKQHPVPELEALRRPILETRARRLSPGVDPLQGIVGTALDIALTVDLEASSATEMRLAVRVGTDESTSIDLNLNDLTLAVDRGHSGRQLPQCSYAEAQLSSVAHRAGTLDLRVLVDSTSVEVFAAGGLVSITQQVLPSRASTRLALYVVGGDAVLTSLEVHELVVEAGRAS